MINRLYKGLRQVYAPRYLALNLVLIGIYYLVFDFLIRYQNYGLFLSAVPVYIEYLTILTASILLTVSIYEIYHVKRQLEELSAGSASIITLILSSVFGGCGCATPIIFGLTALGISSTELFSVNAILSGYIIWIFYVLLVVNAVLILYYLNRISTGPLKSKRRNRR